LSIRRRPPNASGHSFRFECSTTLDNSADLGLRPIILVRRVSDYQRVAAFEAPERAAYRCAVHGSPAGEAGDAQVLTDYLTGAGVRLHEVAVGGAAAQGLDPERAGAAVEVEHALEAGAARLQEREERFAHAFGRGPRAGAGAALEEAAASFSANDADRH
jgi:hypothetical protein